MNSYTAVNVSARLTEGAPENPRSLDSSSRQLSGRLYVPGRAPFLAVLGCGVLIAAVKLSLGIAGFRSTLTTVDRIARRTWKRQAGDVDAVDRSTQSVAMAAAFFPGRALCLEQSLTLYGLLKRHGLPVRLRLGVEVHPFEAHAWVEYRGIPVHEDAEKLKRFLPLPEFTG